MNYYKIIEAGNSLEIQLYGDLNIHSIDPMLNEFKSLAGRKPESIAINCLNLDSIDSSGLGALISMSKQAEKEDIHFYICELNKRISTLFDISNLSRYFNIIPIDEFRRINQI